MPRTIQVEGGPHAFIKALFQRAFLDIAADNGHAREAEEFLRDPGTTARLADWGVDPEYYLQMLDNADFDPDADLNQRIRALHRWGLSRTEITLELWGACGSSYFERVNRVLGPSRKMRGRKCQTS